MTKCFARLCNARGGRSAFVLPLLIASVTLGVFLLAGCPPPKSQSICLLKFATHPALDELESSFLQHFAQLNPSITVTQMNANGDPVSAKQLAESASAKSPSPLAIVSLATPATQAVAKSVSSIPLIYAAVADPAGAGVLSPRSTGIQNAGPTLIEAGLDVIQEVFPNAKRIGTVYNPAEQNSIYVQGLLADACAQRKLVLVARTVSDANQLPALVEQMKSEIDVLYCTNDNTVNKGVRGVADVCSSLSIPFVIGELSAVEKGPLLGVGVEYAAMGGDLARLVNRVLARSSPSDPLPAPQGPPQAQIWYNSITASRIRVDVPAAVRARATRSF